MNVIYNALCQKREGRDAEGTHGKACLGIRPKNHQRTKYATKVISWTGAAPAPARPWVTTQQTGQQGG